MQSTIRLCRPAQPWVENAKKIRQTSATLRCKPICNCDIGDSIWQVHCVELIPEASDLRFATASRDRSTESLEMVHQAQSKCAYRRSGVHPKIWDCPLYYSGVRKTMWNMPAMCGARRGQQKSSFTTVLSVRRARSDERVVSRRGLPNLPCLKKKDE